MKHWKIHSFDGHFKLNPLQIHQMCAAIVQIIWTFRFNHQPERDIVCSVLLLFCNTPIQFHSFLLSTLECLVFNHVFARRLTTIIVDSICECEWRLWKPSLVEILNESLLFQTYSTEGSFVVIIDRSERKQNNLEAFHQHESDRTIFHSNIGGE